MTITGREKAKIYQGAYPLALKEQIVERSLTYAKRVDELKGQERVMRNLGALLFELRNIGKQGAVVEIGSFRGKTTVFLSRICETLHPTSLVISIDPYSPAGAKLALHIDPTKIENVYKGFRTTVASLDNHIHLRMTSKEAARKLPDGIMLSFIDGEHTFEGVTHDFFMLFEKTQIGGVIALDDFKNMAWPGVVKGFIQIVKKYKNRIRLIHEDGKTAYFQKMQA